MSRSLNGTRSRGGPAARFGVDGRWLTGGPPSGVNYVRRLLGELAAQPIARQTMVFAKPGADHHLPAGSPLRVRPVRGAPSLAFNLLAIPALSPGSVRSVLYQNYTPIVGRGAAVTVIHDLIFLAHPELFTPAERAYLGLIPRLLPRAARIAAVSSHVRDVILERFPGRDPATVTVAPNGVSERLLAAAADPTDPADLEHLRRLGIDGPYVLYLGRINARKNLARLVAAFEDPRLAGLQLVIAGQRSGAVEDLEGTASRLRLSGRLRMPGFIPDDDLPLLLRQAAAFAYVSLDEGFGVPPLEAMAFGTPVVCSDIAPLRETAAGGGALFVSPTDVESIAQGLATAIEDTAAQARARRLGPEHAATFRWATTAAIVEGVMREAAAS
jgi:glycosyltransferase involved in cell wall biosynthesis